MIKKSIVGLFLISCVFSATSMQTLSFQGKLLDNTGAAVTGTRAMTFTLYPQATGGTTVSNAIWSQSVAVQNGIYSVELDASAVDLSNVNDAWIEVTVAGEILSPRIHLTSGAFAKRSAQADLAITANYAVTANNLQDTVFVDQNKVGIGTATPTVRLDVVGPVKHDGVTELNWIGSIAGNESVSYTFTHASQSSMEITAVFNHYGLITSHGAARKSLVANGPNFTAVDIVNVSSELGGAWVFTRNSNTSMTITKTAGTYVGGGYYFITVRGYAGLSKQ